MSASAAKTVNHRALIGNIKRFDARIHRVFEQAILPKDYSQNIFDSFTGEPLDRREIQTYAEWKVQWCFRNLSRRQRKRSKRKVIYILPVGPFPEPLWNPVQGMEISVFQLIANFMEVFFHGMSVKIMDQILVSEMNCKRRVHAVTGKLQLLVSDVLNYLKNCLPKDGYCIIGLTWIDLYPGEQWNFVLGESSCVDGCAVMSFGHFEPQSFVNEQLTQSQRDSGDASSFTERTVSGAAESLQRHSLINEKGSQVELRMYLEDCADNGKINKEMIWRLLRVTSHEICHVFGMSHCAYFACAMNESKSVFEAESQPLFLCPVCLRKLQKAINFDILERYKALHHLLHSVIGCNISRKDSDAGLSGISDCKFKAAIHWLKSMLVFIGDKSVT